MAIPATNITSSTVNTNLGNTATAELSLDNARVRSLGSNSGASGTAFSVSSLGSKSGTFIMLTNTTANFTTDSSSSGYAFSTQPQMADAFYSTSIETSSLDLALTKYYLNSGIRLRAAFKAPGSVALYGNGVATSPSTTSNLFVGTQYYLAGVQRAGILKLNTALQVVAQCYIPNYTSAGGVVVDASENIYFSGGTTIGGSTSQYVLVALNPTMTTMRWNKTRTDSPITPQCTDTLGNLYAIIGDTSLIQRIVKFNSSGTQLFQTTTRPSVAGFVASVNCNGSGTFAALSWSGSGVCLAFYSSAGAFQWARQLGGITDSSSKVFVTSAGDVYCVCAASDISLYIFRFNSSGTLVWQRRLTASVTSGAITPNLFFPQGAISVVGAADGVLTVAFTLGYDDGYSYRAEGGLLSVQTDGSGAGTYATGGVTFTYAASSLAIAILTSVTNTTVALNSDTIYIPQPVSPVSATPAALTTSTVNI
jgi:hypothetical protein